MPMPGYLVKQECIAIDGAADLTIRSLLDRQQFSDPLGLAAGLGISAAAWPLFGLLWPSGTLLAAAMAKRKLRDGERVLELGCGLALASLVAHRRGVDITASDCHPLAAAFLRENLRLNGLPAMKYRHGRWGDALPSAGQLDQAADTDVRGCFDLIIGSDLLYERDDAGLLAAFIGRHSAPSGEVWIVDPERGNRSAFNRRMALLGFARTEQRLDRPVSETSPAYKGRLMVFCRSVGLLPSGALQVFTGA